ncbi:MAG: hypothetical protein LBJ76_03335 [Candidatus Accumulibacter sp.]|nr:hypothetical protein [Accumulibacter sp.]
MHVTKVLEIEVISGNEIQAPALSAPQAKPLLLAKVKPDGRLKRGKAFSARFLRKNINTSRKM